LFENKEAKKLHSFGFAADASTKPKWMKFVGLFFQKRTASLL
jgi:hypothetical protein